MRRLVIAFVSSLAIAACGKDPAGTHTVPLGPGPQTVTPSEMQLMQLKANWTAERNRRDYSFVTSYYCFCSGNTEVPVRVTVHDAEIVSVREVTSGRSRLATEYYTIEALLDRAIEARARDVPVRVPEVAALGYPSWLTIGTPENDGGVTYHIEDVRLK